MLLNFGFLMLIWIYLFAEHQERARIQHVEKIMRRLEEN